MIGVLIFYLHIAGFAYAFTKAYHEHKLVDGFMALAFVAVIFTVGWTIAGLIVTFAIPEKGLGPIDSDTVSLLIVTLLEAVLYIGYFRGKKRETAAIEG